MSLKINEEIGLAPTEDDFKLDPEYQHWIDGLTKQCMCTPVSLCPCEGLLAGGLCDELHIEDGTMMDM